ncbi:phage head closure protein [Burkholderia sp. USMB20]|uniref:phage head closure protein n=1 Tax=Burkholderia sp. USMB20 TaxID=1571773 RepID=UPI0022A77162|nr:phage head closure protein [Burkholderia sp. USMB20]
MTLRAGSLNRRVMIEARNDKPDVYGDPGKSWVPVGSGDVWASIKVLSGIASVKADAEISEIRASIRLRFRADLRAGMRVTERGTGATFDVKAVLPDLEGREYVDLVCLGVRSG